MVPKLYEYPIRLDIYIVGSRSVRFSTCIAIDYSSKFNDYLAVKKNLGRQNGAALQVVSFKFWLG